MLCDTRGSGAFSLFRCWSDSMLCTLGAPATQISPKWRSNTAVVGIGNERHTVQLAGGPSQPTSGFAPRASVQISEHLAAQRHFPPTLVSIGVVGDHIAPAQLENSRRNFRLFPGDNCRLSVCRFGRRETSALFVSGRFAQSASTTRISPSVSVQAKNNRQVQCLAVQNRYSGLPCDQRRCGC